MDSHKIKRIKELLDQGKEIKKVRENAFKLILQIKSNMTMILDLNELKCKGCNHSESKHKGKTRYCTEIDEDHKMCPCSYFR